LIAGETDFTIRNFDWVWMRFVADISSVILIGVLSFCRGVACHHLDMRHRLKIDTMQWRAFASAEKMVAPVRSWGSERPCACTRRIALLFAARGVLENSVLMTLSSQMGCRACLR
jgi:hypothetical protein